MDRFLSHFQALPWVPLYTQSGGTPPFSVENVSPTLYWALALTVAFTVSVYAVEGYLDARQWSSYQQTKFPDALAMTVSAIDVETKAMPKEEKKEDSKEGEEKEQEQKLLLPQLQEKFRKAQSYGLDKIQFGMVASLYDVVESVAFLLIGFQPYMWDLSCQKASDWFGWTETENEIKVSLLFVAFTTVVGTVTSLPFELYSTFQIERKHGFNKQTIGLFVTDKIKGLALGAIFGGPFVAALLYIIKAGGEYFYLYVWAFMFAFSVIMMTLYPTIIMPLFNKYEPLPEGTLKTRSTFR
jgi:STE24 endopeptidase